MELNNINVQLKVPSCSDSLVKNTELKDKENEFSKVYKDVSNKSNNHNLKSKVEALKEENYSIDDKTITSTKTQSLGKKTAEDAAKEDKDLNKLLELLILSGNTNQNLLSVLTSSNNIDKNELKEILSKMLKDNLSGSLLSKDNALNLMLTTSKVPSTDEIDTKQESSIDNISKMIFASGGTLDDSIDKLSAIIANKLASDKTFDANLLSNILEKLQGPIVENDNSLKELIIKQLYGMTDKKKSILQVDSRNTKTLARESIQTQTSNTDLSSDVETEALDASMSKTTPTEFKLEADSSDKEDLLLKKLLDSDSLKSNKDNVSDKIANILNRFEAVRIDKPNPVESKVSINKATFSEDFIKTVKFMDLNNLKELSVKVLPKDLGEIVIRLSMDNGVMKANITATNKDTYNLLNSQLPTISNQLSEQNMAIQNFSLSLYNGDNFLFNGDGRSNENTKQQSKNSNKVNSIEDLDLQKEQYFEEHSSVNILA